MSLYKAGPRRRRPTHPGAIFKRQLEFLGLSAYAAAPLIGVSRTALGNILNERSAVSAEMALRLGKFFSNGPELWMGLQADIDLWDASARLRDKSTRMKAPPHRN